MELDEHLFRREAGRLVAALTRVFGVHNLALAEDVVQDAFCRAIEVWKAQGLPDNPAAWLMTTAKRRALDIVRRERTARTFAPEVSYLLESEQKLGALFDDAFAAGAIRDEQLRMMFSCCQPQLPENAQIALILNVLCGFGPGEIAAAFLASRAAIEKRISRGKKELAAAKRLFDLSAADFEARLSTVQRALYLLFNEGYHGASPEAAVQQQLCDEARRLVGLLREHPPAATPSTHALAALMCLHAARLGEKLDAAGELTPLAAQDRSRWDATLTREGLALLERAASGDALSAYHLEAAIAAIHASAESLEATDWASIVGLYDRLLQMAHSPVVALNRAIALSRRDGPAQGLLAAREITDERLSTYPFYAATLAELELACGNPEAARRHFRDALGLARSDAERRFLEKRLAAC
ncbi:MAG: sigma factor [Polyangiaceae bacterium]